jgi:hypothetical protein
MGKARTAIDMVAEAALLNNVTEIVTTRSFPADFDMEAYIQAKVELSQEWGILQPLLQESAALAATTIRTVTADDLKVEVQMPWGPFSLAEVIAYPYWNMKYHEGQINYIASMLGCLD